MTDRIVDLSMEPAKVSSRLKNLVIERKDKPIVSIPLPEIAALVLAHKQISVTSLALAGVVQHGGVVISCDEKCLPAGMMTPLVGHSTQTERMAIQVSASQPARKQIWKQIVIAKVSSQASVLEELHEHDHGLRYLAERVQSGDKTNIEAQAARKYWEQLFAEVFRRDRDAEDQNRYLNYGYTILRAVTARALCSSGLHPSLGVHHHNRYDAFCLADDLMEPFRVLVDRTVVRLVRQFGGDAPMTTEIKGKLLAGLVEKMDLDGEWRTLFDILSRSSASLVEVLAGNRKKVTLPAFK